jgi:hypothetical protein
MKLLLPRDHTMTSTHTTHYHHHHTHHGVAIGGEGIDPRCDGCGKRHTRVTPSTSLRGSTVRSKIVFIAALGFLIPTTAAAALTSDDAKSCNANVGPIDFLLLEGDANAEAVEDEIRTDLEKLGFTIKSRFLPKMEYNEARKF